MLLSLAWCLVALSLIASFPARTSASSAPVEQINLPSKLEKQVEEWVVRLAEQPPFKAWQTTDPQIEALGPGTHSWLVLFTKEGKDIGYMVVHAVTDGTFQLGEYGVGPYPLFSKTLLKQSLIDGGLMPAEQSQPVRTSKHYVHPFAAAWEVSIGNDTYWFDAKTAEQIPVDGAKWTELFPSSKPVYQGPPSGTRIVTAQLNDPFDAYERLPWLTEEAPFPSKEASALQRRLAGKQHHLRYVTEPFGDAMLYAVPVIGYQSWSNGRLDLAIDMAGTRYIPVGSLIGKGLFYR
jgi:hypothetical protein